MRLTALCVCGTLLAFSTLSWTIEDSDGGDLLRNNGFWPCAATLRPEGPCRLGQDESTCPYLFSLPPLTVHLPKQLSELENILEDLQKLKDNVDELKKMCADCTVSQTERECGRRGDREYEKLMEGTTRQQENWLNERNRLKEFSKDCGTDGVKAEKSIEGDTDSEKRTISEEKAKKKWEAERERDSGVVKGKENKETLKEVAEKDGKIQKEGAKEKDKFGSAKVPSASGNDGIVDMVGKRVVEENNRERETDRSEEKGGRRNAKGDREHILENGKKSKITSEIKNKKKTEESDHHVWRDESKETERKTQTERDRSRDGIKMSGDHDEHTNKEQHREERKTEMEKGIKVERNNEKPKQTESIGRTETEETIKKGEERERETGKEIKTQEEKAVQSVQRDGDGESGSSKATERTDFGSISPTPHSTISLTPRHYSLDSNAAVIFTSPLSSPSLSSSTSYSIAGDTQGMTITADGLPTRGTRVVGISEHESSDAEADFRITGRSTTTATITTLGGPAQLITSASTTSTRPRTGPLGQVSSSMATATTTTPRQTSFTTTFPGLTDRSHWTAKKNIDSNTESGVILLPGQGPKPGEKHKPAIKPEADGKLKNPKNDRKPDRALLTDKKTKHDQKQKPQQKPSTDQKSKPGKDPKRVHIPKPDQRPPPDDLPTDQNLKHIQTPKHDQEHETDRNQKPVQIKKSNQKPVLPDHRPTSHQRPQTVNVTGSDKDPLSDREPENDEIPIINQNTKPAKKPVHPLKPDQRPDQKQKLHKKPKSEEKPKSDQRSTLKHYFTPEDPQEPENERPETTSVIPKPHQMPGTELMENNDEHLSTEPKSVQDGAPRQKFTPDRVQIKPPDQRPKPRPIPKTNQKQKPGQTPRLNRNHPDLATGQKTKPNLKPKVEQKPQTKQELKTPRPNQMPNLNPKSVPDSVSERESNKTTKLWPLPRHRPPTRPTVKPGATSVQRPKPSVQLRPSPKTKTDLDPPPISRTTSVSIQNSQTNIPPASGRVKNTADVTRSPGDTEFSPSKMKTITLGPKASNSLETAPSTPLHTLLEGFTMSPNSRITSDLRPQTATQPPSIPMTTSTNKIMPGTLPNVIPSTSPAATMPKQVSNTDSRLQDKLRGTSPRQTPDLDKMMIPVPPPNDQTISTTSPDLWSTNPANSGPKHLDPEASTPSARELRVKINQVAAFFNNSPNGRLPDMHPIEHPEDNQGGSRPDKLPTLITSKETMARRDCSDYLLRGETKSGVYLVTPDLRSRSFPVFCDMELDGGGWTLLQRRQDGSVNFNRTWAEYRSGFGDLVGGEFWLGNNMMHLLTRDRDMVLRVELEDFDRVMEYAEYEQFKVASERMRYRLTVGGYSGTAGDALRFSKSYDHNNRGFTTPDRDHDRYPSGNCGAYYSSGWWFDACMAANLNGRYYVGKYKGVRDGIFWGTWHNISTEYYPTNERQSFKAVRMMIRPKGFKP